MAVQLPRQVSRIVVHRAKSSAYHSNNDAEWLAARAALQVAQVHYAGYSILLHSDSRLVVNQFVGLWRTTVPHHHALRDEVRRLAKAFASCTIVWCPREVMVDRLGH